MNVQRTPAKKLLNEKAARAAFYAKPKGEDGRKVDGTFEEIKGNFDKVSKKVSFGGKNSYPAIYTFSSGSDLKQLDSDYLEFFFAELAEVFAPSPVAGVVFREEGDAGEGTMVFRIFVASDDEYKSNAGFDLKGRFARAITERKLALDAIQVPRRVLTKGSDHRIFIPTQSIECWKSLLADPDKQWSPGYSAQSLAEVWHQSKQNKDKFPTKISRLLRGTKLGASGIDLLLGLPERDTPMPGKGKASFTDLFCLAKSGSGELISMAVEGKVRESFGPLVCEWLAAGKGKGSKTNRLLRISEICKLLGTSYSEAVMPLWYQLFHRTAAAVVEAKRFNCQHALMLVHSFDRSKPPVHFSEFRDFSVFLGLEKEVVIPNSIHEVKCLSGGITLWLGWVSDSVKS